MTDATSKKELQARLVDTLRKWQQLEERSAASAAEIVEASDHPLLRQVMEIIRSDSERHREVQQLVIDTLTERAPSLTPEQMADVWDRVEEHVELEQSMIRSVEEALAGVSGQSLMIQEYLLRYLLADERKHQTLLTELDRIKRGMVPYGA